MVRHLNEGNGVRRSATRRTGMTCITNTHNSFLICIVFIVGSVVVVRDLFVSSQKVGR